MSLFNFCTRKPDVVNKLLKMAKEKETANKAESKWRGRCVTAGTVAGKGALALALAGIAAFGLLGVLQYSGHLSLPNSFSWLSTGLRTVGHPAAFGAMMGVAASIPFLMLVKKCCDKNKEKVVEKEEIMPKKGEVITSFNGEKPSTLIGGVVEQETDI